MVDSILSYFTAGGQLYGLFHQALPEKNEEVLQKLCHGKGTKQEIALYEYRLHRLCLPVYSGIQDSPWGAQQMFRLHLQSDMCSPLSQSSHMDRGEVVAAQIRCSQNLMGKLRDLPPAQP